MNQLTDLYEYELIQLQSIDPYLSNDWQGVVMNILPELDRDAQHAVMEKILKPKGIRYDSAKRGFVVEPTPTLVEVFKAHPTDNKQLLKAIHQMLDFLRLSSLSEEKYDAVLLADETEAILNFLDTIPINPDNDERRVRQKLRTAFLYELADWVLETSFEMPKTLRRLDETVFKCYFREVFIKQQIQGWGFKYLEAVDLDLYQISHFPKFIAQEAKNRKLLLVETKEYWFLISTAENTTINPFSIRRFLYEETTANFTYLNNVVVPKRFADNEVTQKFISLLVERIYSLDTNIGEDVKKFILLLKDCVNHELAPIFKEPLSASGLNVERTISNRTLKFEERLSSVVLQRLPYMFAIVRSSEEEREFLFGHLTEFFMDILALVDNFRLHPLVRYSFVAQNLSTKIAGYSIMLQKNKLWLCSNEISNQEREEVFQEAMPKLRQCYEDGMVRLKEIQSLREGIKVYQHKQTTGNWHQKAWQKLGFGKPKYSMDDLKDFEKELNNEFFADIIRLAKSHRKAVVYLEYESDYLPNEDFRHYIIANEDGGITRLPYVIALPEDRSLFSLENIQDDVYWEIFTHVDNV